MPFSPETAPPNASIPPDADEAFDAMFDAASPALDSPDEASVASDPIWVNASCAPESAIAPRSVVVVAADSSSCESAASASVVSTVTGTSIAPTFDPSDDVSIAETEEPAPDIAAENWSAKFDTMSSRAEARSSTTPTADESSRVPSRPEFRPRGTRLLARQARVPARLHAMHWRLFIAEPHRYVFSSVYR